ncbi:hypothetical protein DVH24_032300 [Malus domestica]|uniref:Uncharacterized protein n=1 Tax=Malus domestica TaxID=3750 RepID=A0A498J805_MALDO|nr:hypothetical protein DVH24_032300 [Malus domestica]
MEMIDSEPNKFLCTTYPRVFQEDTFRLVSVCLSRLGDSCHFKFAKVCICQQNIAKYVLKSDHMKKFFITNLGREGCDNVIIEVSANGKPHIIT